MTDDRVMLRIEVVHALPDEQFVLPLDLPEGTTVADALAIAAQDLVFGRFDLQGLTTAIWGERVEHGQRLRHGDRLELLRPLHTDPKSARRLRAKR